MRYGLLALCIGLLLAPATALAEDLHGPEDAPTLNETWREGNQIWTRSGRCITVEVDPATIEPQPVPLAAPHHLLYVNRCAGGETYYSANSDDSRSNRSQIIRSTKTLAEFPYSDATWNTMMARIKRIYAPFNITVTDVDPGSEPHAEAVVCGSSAAWGAGDGVLGISPFSCTIVSNSVSFVFPVDHGDNAIGLAETVTHEAGHAFTLEHEMICDDIMWWSSECEGEKYFYDQSAQCGDGSAEGCYCGGLQNSYQDLIGTFGVGSPDAPTVTITAPTPNQEVEQGFVVGAEVEDSYGAISRAELYIDGDKTKTVNTAPYYFNAPTDLGDGSHEVEVRAYNMFDVMGSDSVYAIIGVPCGGADDCDDGETCVDGRCVAGPGTPGGLGEICEEGIECDSGICGNDGATKLCTEICDPARDGCPDGFTCTAAGDDGVCWPGADGGGGGCAVGDEGGPSPWPILLIALSAIAILNRRRRT